MSSKSHSWWLRREAEAWSLNRFWKFRNFSNDIQYFGHLNDRTGYNRSINEQMVSFTGEVHMRQYIWGKPNLRQKVFVAVLHRKFHWIFTCMREKEALLNLPFCQHRLAVSFLHESLHFAENYFSLCAKWRFWNWILWSLCYAWWPIWNFCFKYTFDVRLYKFLLVLKFLLCKIC